MNILQKYHALYKEEPKAVFSGFHMRRKDGYSKEDLSTIRQIAEELKTYRTVFYTGHCTGEEPFRIMKEIMGSQLVYLHSGDTVIL